jgi:hypothetical protein
MTAAEMLTLSRFALWWVFIGAGLSFALVASAEDDEGDDPEGWYWFLIANVFIWPVTLVLLAREWVEHLRDRR